MKKLAWIILALALIAGLILILWPRSRQVVPAASRGVLEAVTLPRARRLDLAGLVPARAGFTLRLYSLRAIVEEIQSRRLPPELAATPLGAELAQWGEHLGQLLDSALGQDLDQDQLLAVLGQDALLALVPGAGGAPAQFLLLAHLERRALLLEVLLRRTDSLQDASEQTLRVEEYAGARLVFPDLGPANPFRVGYTLIEGNLALALALDSPRALLAEVLDLANGGGEPLARLAEYRWACSGAATGSGLLSEAYLRPAGWGSLQGWTSLSGPLSEVLIWGEEVAQSLSGTAAVGLSLTAREGWRIDWNLVLDQEPGLEAPSPAELAPLPFPAGGCLYAQADLASLGALLNRLAPGLLASLAADLLPDSTPLWQLQLGPGAALYLGGVTGREFLPLPPAALALDLNAPAATGAPPRDLAPLVEAAVGGQWVRRREFGVETHSLRGLFFIEPTWAQTDARLWFASTRSLLGELLSQSEGGGEWLASAPGFPRVAAELPRHPSLLLYLDGPRFRETIQAAGNWYRGVSALFTREPDSAEREWLERILTLLPLTEPIRGLGIALAHEEVDEKNLVITRAFLYIPPGQ